MKSASEFRRRVESSPACQRPDRLTIAATGDAPFPFGDSKPVMVSLGVDEFSQEVGDRGFECRVETALPLVEHAMQGDDGAQVAWPEVVPQVESNSYTSRGQE
jgi:hypothetical protein